VARTTWRGEQQGDSLALGMRGDALLIPAHCFFHAKHFELHDDDLR
jgi:hypothetical protein